METAVKIILVVACIWIVWRFVRPKPDFVIVVEQDEVRIRGRLPAATRDEIVEFLRADVQSIGTARISGRRGQDGYLSLDFSTGISKEDRQRIRNFLITRF